MSFRKSRGQTGQRKTSRLTGRVTWGKVREVVGVVSGQEEETVEVSQMIVEVASVVVEDDRIEEEEEMACGTE